MRIGLISRFCIANVECRAGRFLDYVLKWHWKKIKEERDFISCDF